jgi:hypothetical protein
MAIYLQHWHLTSAFVETVTVLVPSLMRIGGRSISHLVVHSISSVMLPVVLFWIPIAYRRHLDLSFERLALLIGVVVGLLSFYLQRKGYPYHRYPSEAILLVVIGLDFNKVIEEIGLKGHWRWPSVVAFLGLVSGVFVVGGGSLVHAMGQDWHNQEFNSLLKTDLEHFGGQALSGHVQYLDNTDFCIPALYNLQLVQATGTMYDCYMLSPDVAPHVKVFLCDFISYPTGPMPDLERWKG